MVDDTEYGPTCARCGGDCWHRQCEECGGHGGTQPGELYEEDPLCYDPDDTRDCMVCEGAGGWWVCGNSEEWCEAHPMPGREAVERGVLDP